MGLPDLAGRISQLHFSRALGVITSRGKWRPESVGKACWIVRETIHMINIDILYTYTYIYTHCICYQRDLSEKFLSESWIATRNHPRRRARMMWDSSFELWPFAHMVSPWFLDSTYSLPFLMGWWVPESLDPQLLDALLKPGTASASTSSISLDTEQKLCWGTLFNRETARSQLGQAGHVDGL